MTKPLPRVAGNDPFDNDALAMWLTRLVDTRVDYLVRRHIRATVWIPADRFPVTRVVKQAGTEQVLR